MKKDRPLIRRKIEMEYAGDHIDVLKALADKSDTLTHLGRLQHVPYNMTSKYFLMNVCNIGWDSIRTISSKHYHGFENDVDNLVHNMHDYENEEYAVNRVFDGESYNIDGVPSEFITSFGSYIGLKYFLDGIKDKKDVYTYINKYIDITTFEKIKELFGSCRYLYNGNNTDYEFFNEDHGYIVITYDKSLPNKYKISTSVGFETLNNIIKDAKVVKSAPTAKWVTGIDSSGDLITKELSIEIINEYNPVYYPFMKGQDIKDYAEKFLNSKSSILLLIGPPGTSKTNFIRQLLSATSESVLLTYSEDLKKMDTLFSYFYDSPERFLIIEDADTYIEKREDGNTNMKQLLNITDGITANPKKKVIFSTNLPNLNHVDQALIRPGRCFDCLEFGRIDGEDLQNVFDHVGYQYFENIEIPSDGMTIAEIFAVKNNERTDIATKSTGKFGFHR